MASLALANPALAQRITDNAATNAEDTFGTSIIDYRMVSIAIAFCT